MGFLSICTAIYDYQPQSAGELEIREGELLYILEKSSDDDWWKAKKKAGGDEEDEPEGLIPNNYVEDAKPTHAAKALYDYSRQTDEEVSFTEDAALEVFDTSDPDWTLVGLNGDYGFAPANYIELAGAAPKSPSIASAGHSVTVPPGAAFPSEPSSPQRSIQSPAATLASVLGARAPASPTAARAVSSPSVPQQQMTPEASDSEEPPPALPQRPRSQVASPTIQPPTYEDDEPLGVLPSPPYNRATPRPDGEDAALRSPGGFHLYNISEMVSAMGRRRKMPVTLGINIATGTIMLSPEKTRDGPSQEWTADKMTHYSIEGKHVFLELIRPSKSLDLHAGTKDTAQEIVAMLGEIAGAQRAEGLKEVIAASEGGGTHKKGQVLYDFMAQGDDEVTVAVGDEVVILDDTKSEEWWNVRRLKNGKEGVMPSSYIEVTGTTSIEPPSRSGINAGRSTVEQNRLEEERLAKEAARSSRRKEADQASSREVGPGMQLPQRGSSLADEGSQRRERKDKRSSKADGKSRSKPDPTKIRTWTDHSGSFKVEAQFVGVADGKIHLHKVNGVKIAVPVTKMSPADLEYVEKMKRKNQSIDTSKLGASLQAGPADPAKTPDYDWFDFFLKAGVGPHQCERYSQAMVRDNMDETVLPDITAETLRTLGLKEGDALKVMKHLDQRFSRNKAPTNGETGDSHSAGIFSGPGGALHNNSGRSRPETNRHTSDVVDPKAFERVDEGSKPPPEARATPLTSVSSRAPQNGFEDDAWTVKPSSQAAIHPAPTPSATPAQNAPASAFDDLSLLDKPLQPARAEPPRLQQQVPDQQQPPPAQAPTQQPLSTGASPGFFSQLPTQPIQPIQPTGQSQQLQPQATGFSLNVPRQRPQAPQQSFTGPNFLAPPPRPTSAPQNPQQNQFGLQPLQPQLTGLPSNARPAPPGQSLDELSAHRMQQQYAQYPQVQPQPTGFQPQGFNQFQNGLQPQQTGFAPQQQFGFQQSYLNGNAAGSPFADPRPQFQSQPTGYNVIQSPQSGGINSMLPPALQPQRTGFQPQQNGFNQAFQPQQTGFSQQQQVQSQPTGFPPQIQPQPTGFGQPLQPQATGFGPASQQNGFHNFSAPPVPPIPQQPTIAPLQPQKTGPPPNIKFGVTEAKKLTPQPTGRRANLANATAHNPFGF